MPTARPIIVIIRVTKNIRSVAWPTRAAAPRATTMATMASRMGRKAARTAPNSTRRMRSAIGTPIRSPFEISSTVNSFSSAPKLDSPAISTWKPSLPSASRTISRRPASMFSVASSRSPTMTKSMIVVCRSRETWNSLPVW